MQIAEYVRHQDESYTTANCLTIASLSLATLLAIVFVPIFAKSIKGNIKIYYVMQQVCILVGSCLSVLISIQESKTDEFHHMFDFHPGGRELSEVK